MNAKKAPRRGRPPRASEPARETFQFRVTAEQRAPWQAAAEVRGQSESEWARDGLDAWVVLCERAAELGVEPRDMVPEAIEAHARVRAAVDELAGGRTLTTREARLLRVLAPMAWARARAAK